jgi:hypothetical protein
MSKRNTDNEPFYVKLPAADHSMDIGIQVEHEKSKYEDIRGRSEEPVAKTISCITK